MHFEFIWLFLILSHVIYQANANFLMYRIYNGGCPYTATFLVHVDFFSRLHYELHWHKMEAVNWNVIGIARFNFQFVNESLYYVHHMSRYEHSSRQKYGYNVSEEMTAIMATAAMKGECNTVRMTNFHNSSIGLVPFYGARPPNVTADLKVKSLGQGNSLVLWYFAYLTCLSLIEIYIRWRLKSKQPNYSLRYAQFSTSLVAL